MWIREGPTACASSIVIAERLLRPPGTVVRAGNPDTPDNCVGGTRGCERHIARNRREARTIRSVHMTFEPTTTHRMTDGRRGGTGIGLRKASTSELIPLWTAWQRLFISIEAAR